MNMFCHLISRSSTPIVRLKSGRSSSLAHSKSYTFTLPGTPSKAVDPFTHLSQIDHCTPLLQLKKLLGTSPKSLFWTGNLTPVEVMPDSET